MKLVLIFALLVTGASGGLSGSQAVGTCAAAGPYWPTMTLAVSGETAWVAGKEQSRLVRVALPGGRRTADVPLDAPAIAVAVGDGAVWALDSSSNLYRIDSRTARVKVRSQLLAGAPYNVWLGAGAVWVADDQGASVLRVSPATLEVTATIRVGDGPADMVFAGPYAWVLTHRDNGLYRIDTRTNRARLLSTLRGGNTAAERLALLAGRLWVTGRGVPLLEVDPDTGATRRTIDLDGTGIDIVAAGGSLWIPVRTAEVDRSGFPTMTALRRVTPDGTVTTAATARGRVDVHGLVAAAGAIWLADNTAGRLYRVRVPSDETAS